MSPVDSWHVRIVPRHPACLSWDRHPACLSFLGGIGILPVILLLFLFFFALTGWKPIPLSSTTNKANHTNAGSTVILFVPLALFVVKP